MTWTARHRAWQERRVRPALERAPERRTGFSTISDVEVERLYGPWSWAAGPDGEPAGPGGPTAVDHLGEPLSPGRWDGFDPLRDVGLPGEPPFTRGIHPTAYRSRLWTMRMFAGFGAAEDTNARFRQLLAAGQTGPVDRLRHAHPVRLRHRRPGGRGRIRDVWRRRQQPGRHGGPAGGPAPRPDQHVDDDQLAGGPDLGDVHRRGRAARRAPGRSSRGPSRTTS